MCQASDRFAIRSVVRDRNMRKKDSLNIPVFLYRATTLWNFLPRAVTAAERLYTFKIN